MRSCAPSIGTVRTRNSTASGFRLRANGEDHFVQRTAQAMQLIDEIENYRNALVVYADVCEAPAIRPQSRPSSLRRRSGQPGEIRAFPCSRLCRLAFSFSCSRPPFGDE